MNNTKYIHVRQPNFNGTIALEIPSKDYLNEVFSTHSNMMFINLGVTKLHPKDKFVKQTGRDRAAGNMSQHVAQLCSVEIDGLRHVYHISLKSTNPVVGDVRLWFSTIKESPNVMLLAGDAITRVESNRLEELLGDDY